jgi:hypothetical protein
MCFEVTIPLLPLFHFELEKWYRYGVMRKVGSLNSQASPHNPTQTWTDGIYSDRLAARKPHRLIGSGPAGNALAD